MKSIAWTKPTLLVLSLLTCVAVGGARADIPAGEFACQVKTKGGKIGLVVVLADRKAMAERVAMGAEAYNTDGTRGPATEIVECVERGSERFADYQFQQFYQAVPR